MYESLRAGIVIVLLCVVCHSYGQNEQDVKNMLMDKSGELRNIEFETIYLKDIYTSLSLGIKHFYFQNQYQGIDIYGDIYNVAIRNGEIANISKPSLLYMKPKTKQRIEATLEHEQALTHALSHLKLGGKPSLKRIKADSRRQGYIYNRGAVASEDILVDLLWLPTEQGELKLAWKVNIYELNRLNWWDVFVDAQSGEILKTIDNVLHCSFDNHHHADSHYAGGGEVNSQLRNSHLDAPSTASYRVFDLPLESPNHGARTLVTDPWLRVGDINSLTDEGWHDDGSNTYAKTRGNNVDAYMDDDGTNSPTNGDADRAVSAIFDFDFPLDPNQLAINNKNAAVTNLFFWNNITHDVMYKYGFDEAAGNFQNDNFGRGGAGGDFVLAEALDEASLAPTSLNRNNANFATPPDGGNGRMQMYIWNSYTELQSLDINSPASITGSYEFLESNFSANNKLADVGPVAGDVVLVQDTNNGTSEACTANPIANGGALNGNIALIDRGNCDFTEKVLNAQNAGAIGVIMVNNVAGAPITMGGTDNSITIPAVMISITDGQIIKDELVNDPVNATLSVTTGTIYPDGDYDNGIIVHEYGHGISTRLTGGPGTNACLTNQEQMGEGWSDYFGLMLTTDWSTAQAADIRGIGTYALGQPTSGTGIRTYPYSTDMGISPYTYDDIKTLSIPHGVGSVWASMLWEMTWEIIADEGIDSDIYSTLGGNGIALQLVIDGLKLQSCNPGFVDGRDAILLADELRYEGAHKCAIWRAFARRGLGVSADQASTGSRSDGTEAFDLPGGAEIIKTASVSQAIACTEIEYTITTTCNCLDVSGLVVEDLLPPGLTYVDGSSGTLNGNKVTFASVDLTAQEKNVVSFRATVDPGTYETPQILIDEDFENGAGGWVATKLSGSGSKNWVMTTSRSNSPSNSWYAQDYNNPGDIVLTSQQIDLNGPSIFTFFHYYDTENTWDGGVVEISDDGGSTWTDAGSLFTQNGYTNILQGFGRNGFTGTSGGFIQSEIDLTSYGTSSIHIRFRMLTDESVGGDGWYVDDLYLESRKGITNTAQVSAGGNILNSSSETVEILQSSTVPTIDVKVFIEGAYDTSTGIMRTDLNTNHLLPGQDHTLSPDPGIALAGTDTGPGHPYTVTPWLFTRTEGVLFGDESTNSGSTSYPLDVVDWIMISVRENGIQPNNEIYRAVGWLKTDGAITFPEECSFPVFDSSIDYYIMIEHQNHLPILSNEPVTVSDGKLIYDFTVVNTYTALFGSGQKEITIGLFAMYSGNSNQTDQNGKFINSIDYLNWENDQNDVGYRPGDYNMNGRVESLDYLIWEANQNISSDIP